MMTFIKIHHLDDHYSTSLDDSGDLDGDQRSPRPDGAATGVPGATLRVHLLQVQDCTLRQPLLHQGEPRSWLGALRFFLEGGDVCCII